MMHQTPVGRIARGRAAWRVAALAAMLLPLAGCGEPKFPELPADERAISDLVDAWNALKDKRKPVDECFAKGALPSKEQLEKLRRCTIAMTARPSINGTSVVVPMRLTSIVAKKQQIDTVDWTFEKEGDSWKIKAAPLP